jgi:hypothetical protein
MVRNLDVDALLSALNLSEFVRGCKEPQKRQPRCFSRLIENWDTSEVTSK